MELIQKNRLVYYKDLHHISYKSAWEYQTILHQELVQRKLANRSKEIPDSIHHYLLFCEHNPVFTLGKSGSFDHLLLKENELEKQGFEFFKINRGGDITYHGPGQITGYPIFDLDAFFTDIHKYIRYLEEVIIKTLAEYNLIGSRIDGYTGVWIKGANTYRKICAIGVHLSRWVTMHGFALNVSTDLEHFTKIIPCGIEEQGMEVTSIEKELDTIVDIGEVKAKLKRHFRELFGIEYLD
jgi:lipoyl(octanoyl) transferase